MNGGLSAVGCGDACAVEADIVIGAFAVESALGAHIGDTDHAVAAVRIFTAFDIVFAFVHGVADTAVTAFGIAQAFGTCDAGAIEADLAFLAVAVHGARTGHQAGTVHAETAFALRTEHALDFFRGVADLSLAGDATAFCAKHVIGAVFVDFAFILRFGFAYAVIADIAVDAICVFMACEFGNRFTCAVVAKLPRLAVGIKGAFLDGFASAAVADFAVCAVPIHEAFRSGNDRIGIPRCRICRICR